MGILAVSYDLNREPSRRYAELFKALRAFPSWCKATESSWFIQTDATPQQVYEYLKSRLHAWDKITVMPVLLNGSWWSQGLDPEVVKWLHSKLDMPVGV